MELGTKVHPYKSLDSVAKELVTYWAHQVNSSVIVNIKESTFTQIQIGALKVLGVGNLTIKSYSDNDGKANKAYL